MKVLPEVGKKEKRSSRMFQTSVHNMKPNIPSLMSDSNEELNRISIANFLANKFSSWR